MNTLIFNGQADSFMVEPYQPKTGLLMPPVVTCPADEALPERMRSNRPPQAVLFDLDSRLNVRYTSGRTASLVECLRLAAHRAALILRVDEEEAARALPAFADAQNIWDVTLCAPYARRGLLPSLRAAMPLSRGMLDCRGTTLPADPLALSAECQRAEATMLLLDAIPSRAFVDSLRRRFIQIWVSGDPAEALCCGACGVLTHRPDALYDLLERMPARSVARPPMLFAHKGYHNTGEYPENSTVGVVAAGQLHFDAAEIDVTLSSDGVLVVQHDPHTEKLFTEKKVLTQTPWNELKRLRRKAFPDHGLDRLEDMMIQMKAWPETPVLIEIKTPGSEYRVEEAVRGIADILARPDVQQAPTCIMGNMPPHLSYVHRHLPTLPVAHCTCTPNEKPTEDPVENNLRVYRFARETVGANAGFNPYHGDVNHAFALLAHLRGITIFGWTWAFEPWEKGGALITRSYLSGYDGLTSDWVEKFAQIPVDLVVLPHAPADPPHVEAVLRDGTRVPVEHYERIPVGDGSDAVICAARFPVPDGTDICLLGIPTCNG